ncbi:hypothetical protein SEA_SCOOBYDOOBYDOO_214 [Mycobacterium phage ScoobyDoobyDoo]|nr:hypothetical protein SEA_SCOOBYDOOBYDOO_214 [Mycobacterium phage ScoobyDoobyDoo]
MPDPRYAAAPGLGGKLNGFLSKSAKAIGGAGDLGGRKPRMSADRIRKEARRGQREANS